MRNHRRKKQKRSGRILTIALVIIAAVAIAGAVTLHNRSTDSPRGPLPVQLPAAAGSYLGVYTHGLPRSYAGITAFQNATGSRPNVVMYYSGWFMPFPAGLATTTANNGAVPLVQMDPENISVGRIAAGHYDGYLSAYAAAVHRYRHPVIVSFGHEMNGNWYSWGYQHTPPATFVAAWRHIVTLFRTLGATNVTWLWTVNIINHTHGEAIPRPDQWWPGSSYVNWVGIDGYYLKPSWKFAPLFGPTITAVRRLTQDPILVAETGAVAAAGQPAKIADLFAGIHDYGLLGFVWFNATNSSNQSFGITTPAARAAFRQGVSTYGKLSS